MFPTKKPNILFISRLLSKQLNVYLVSDHVILEVRRAVIKMTVLL